MRDYQNQNAHDSFEQKMRSIDLPDEVIGLFKKYLSRLYNPNETLNLIPEQEISPLEYQDLAKLSSLTLEHEQYGKSILDKAVMIKLNGGLGTSMGMPYAKSLLTLRQGYTFLDIILKQANINAEAGEFFLILMNSLNTDRDVRDYLDKYYSGEKQPRIFKQHDYPKVLAQNLEPAVYPQDPQLEWNPPGHGDIYASLWTSGMLEELLEAGKRYAFISNADNLGASINPKILGYFAQNGFPLLMEVARRSPSDKKGGHLAKYSKGKLILREEPQCPKNDLQYFQDIERHRFFNTNNIWVDLEMLRDYIENNGLPELPLIVNPKNLNPRREDTPEVYQLETAMGAAVSVFENSRALQVERDRFVPVKKTNDLLAIRSDCFVLNENLELSTHPERKLGPVEINLDSNYYKKVDQFEQRFPWGVPSLLYCESLKVVGDVLFESGVTCRGKVEVKNSDQVQRKVSSGSELIGEVLLGS